jgi:hypothetical protein
MTISATTQGLRPGVTTSSNRPVSPFEGQMIYETDTDLTYIYGGSAWQQVSGGTAVGNSGLVLVKAQTVGSGVSSVTVTDAFSATYKSYLIQMTNVASSAGGVITFQLTGLTTGYYGNLMYANFAGGAPTSAGYSNASQFTHAGGTNGVTANLNLTCINPFLTQNTIMTSDFIDSSNAGRGQAYQSSTTSVTGFNIGLTAGTLTGGQITIYGYRNG